MDKWAPLKHHFQADNQGRMVCTWCKNIQGQHTPECHPAQNIAEQATKWLNDRGRL